MKNTIKAIFLSVLITFGSFFMSTAYAQGSDLDAYCNGVGITAGSISQFFVGGKTIKDLEPQFKSSEFLKLTPDEQEFVKVLAQFIFFAGKEIDPMEHYIGAMGACIEFQGNLKSLTDAIQAELNKHKV